ncbi:tRNA preQ1(34) S-adenosylmethionine ribosyltransferase-isomerase QueA [Candidatus Woesearchaeota archaeon]|jgi:S-adenosylmethionine:tRNA ribosyltransferase-isomerase|nr:tRNA preQ1(34) S-adenosylmethionine ribosyltransferase-isomerase QueA [Candidatus Woesearchaeota archaeon]
MNLEDFNYELPEKCIAQEPAKPRDHSKLMIVDSNRNYSHKKFFDIIDLFKSGDVLVLNETKVVHSKIVGCKKTGSPAEIVLTKKIDQTKYECRIKTRNPHVGQECIFEKELVCKIIFAEEGFFKIEFNKPPEEILAEIATFPTPPYIKQAIKEKDYQTTYANDRKKKSLAAPTAGLHFTDEILFALVDKGVKLVKICLHVDFGTFMSVRSNIKEHKMHEEYFEINSHSADVINNREGRLFVVGTTSLRALESADYDSEGKIIPTCKYTNIFIYPGYKFKCGANYLLTNFHLPKSTLILLVSAFAGRENVLNSYECAKQENYRFYSLGDCMLLSKKD